VVATTTPKRRTGLAADLAATDARLRPAVDAWRRSGGPDKPGVPPAVAQPARHQQALLRRLASHPGLTADVLRRLRGGDRRAVRDVVAAQRALHVLNAPQRTKRARRQIRLGPAAPAGALLRFFREGERRSGISWPVLAAVNLVESDFGRLRNDSIAGAQGPMQFIASTWATYGHGGDVHDPHDAILGAARFLRAAGGAADVRGALYAYNPSPLYVTAVSRYARLIARDPRAFYALYAWAPPVPQRR
jgi:membrane-bound lytic murein transglycosylase B